MNPLDRKFLYVVRRREAAGGVWVDAAPASGIGAAGALLAALSAREPSTRFDLFPADPSWVRLRAEDAPAIVAHLLSLPPEDLRSRFHGAVSAHAVEARYRGLDWDACVLVGFRPGGRLMGVAEAVLDDPERPEAAEVAVSVDRSVAGRGVGRALVRHAAGIAAARGAAQAKLLFARGDRAIPRIVRALGGAVDAIRAEGCVAPRATDWWHAGPLAA